MNEPIQRHEEIPRETFAYTDHNGDDHANAT